ncbi:hypothetical protein A2W24_06760 [Microgenomates group bacterium RBG_16_45_19]|nr:MAG: hypothetical protein A2W24_06760 [Microgenomates group bacterium RBG_16_45_19]
MTAESGGPAGISKRWKRVVLALDLLAGGIFFCRESFAWDQGGEINVVNLAFVGLCGIIAAYIFMDMNKDDNLNQG